MKGKLDGKVAIVTASTEGIGYGIAQNLASHGASVMVSSRKVKASQPLSLRNIDIPRRRMLKLLLPS